MPPFVRIAVLAAFMSTAGWAIACSTEHTETEDAGDPTLADVVYVGATSDEALGAMLDVSPTNASGKGAALDTPAEGATLPAATAATFKWHAQTADARPVPGPRHRTLEDWRLPGDLRTYLGVTDAFAHGTPFSGSGYFLVVSSASHPKLLRVFTDATSYTPTAAEWQKLAGAGTLTATVTTAAFDTNKLLAGSVPYAGAPVHFTVAP